MKTVKIILAIVVIALVAIQFIPNRMPSNKPVSEQDIIHSGQVTGDMAKILKTSCYDCHSEQTEFPWYSKMAPTSWLLADDITNGRKNLNFSEWNSYTKRKKIGKLEAIREEVSSGEMPLPVYLLMHRRSKLSPEQVEALSQWTDDMTKKILE